MGVRVALPCLAAIALVLAAGAGGAPRQVPDSLVFVRGGDLYRVTVDGAETVRLTATKARESDPAVSPDTLTVAFGRNADELWTSDTQGNGARKVVAARPRSVRYASTGSPSWSADGRTVYFSRVSQTPNEICGSIYRVSAAGGPAKRVTAGVVRGSLETDPAVSPDGRRIALVIGDCVPGCCPGLGVVDTAGRPTADLRKLGRTPGIQLDPNWSPDGTRLTFVVDDIDGTGRSAVYVVNRDGSGLRRVTQWAFDSGGPAWSPGGDLIVFHKKQGLFLVSPDGKGMRPVPGTKPGDASAAWMRRI